MSDLLTRYGPCALVTGASSGIGEAFARCLAAQGFQLILTGQRDSALKTLARELEQQHAISVKTVAVNLGTSAGVDELIEAMKDISIHLLVSNAGFGLKGSFEREDIRITEEMVYLNCVAGQRLTHALLPAMKQARRGGIIFTGSIEGYSPFPLSASYCASKAFIGQFAGALWGEVHDVGIDVMLLSPGSTATAAHDKQGIDKSQLKGVMSPGDVASQALQQLGRKLYFTPGWQNRMLMGVFGLLPKRMAITLAGKAMRASLLPEHR